MMCAIAEVIDQAQHPDGMCAISEFLEVHAETLFKELFGVTIKTPSNTTVRLSEHVNTKPRTRTYAQNIVTFMFDSDTEPDKELVEASIKKCALFYLDGMDDPSVILFTDKSKRQHLSIYCEFPDSVWKSQAMNRTYKRLQN